MKTNTTRATTHAWWVSSLPELDDLCPLQLILGQGRLAVGAPEPTSQQKAILAEPWNKRYARLLDAQTAHEQQMAGVVGAGPSMANEAASVAQLTDEQIVILRRETDQGAHAPRASDLAFARAILAQAAPPAAPVQGDALTDGTPSNAQQAARILSDLRGEVDGDGVVKLRFSQRWAIDHAVASLLAAPAAPATGESGDGRHFSGGNQELPSETMARIRATPPAAKSEAASQPGEMGAGVAHELQFVLNVMEDVKAGLETKAVHRITLGKAIEKARALLLAAPCDASPTSPLHKFLNAAAGEGLVLDGVDAADLYIATFPKEYEAQSAQIVTRAASERQDERKCPECNEPIRTRSDGTANCSRCSWWAPHDSALQDEREAGILGPDADGLPIARYSHRAHGMAEHPNGTWVRYSEVAGRIRAARQAQPAAQQDEREAGELEPCRWCNQTPRVADDTNLAIHVACKCGVQMWGHRSHFGSREEAIAAWNRRSAQQVQADAGAVESDKRETVGICPKCGMRNDEYCADCIPGRAQRGNGDRE